MVMRKPQDEGVFQSAPANYGGRIVAATSADGRSVFQSAPANYGGRIGLVLAPIHAATWFQSAPANYGGRIVPVAGSSVAVVSIRARQLRRANPIEVSRIIRYALGFNPRPPITAGESNTAHRVSAYAVGI